MLDSAKLRECLVPERIITAGQYDQAVLYAEKQAVSIDSAIIELNYIDMKVLGEALSKGLSMQYQPLLDLPSNPHISSIFSIEFAAMWKVFPFQYDAEDNILVVAVHDPIQTCALEQVNEFFMQDYRLRFAIASLPEIEAALTGAKEREAVLPPPAPPNRKQSAKGTDEGNVELSKEYGASVEGSASGKADAEVPGKDKQKGEGAGLRRLKIPASDGLPLTASVAPRRKRALKKQGAPAEESVSFEVFIQMGRALVAAVSFMVRARLSGNEEKLADIVKRVRYCDLLASRLEFDQLEDDAVVLAAWLSGLDDCHGIARQLITPHKLEEILQYDETDIGAQREEAQLLGLVRCYEDFRKSEENIDVDMTRRHLQRFWSSETRHQDTLETFLQLLMDEEFLAQLDRGTGRILVVSATESVKPILSTPLKQDGYEVEIVVNAGLAEKIVESDGCDLVICERNLPDSDGLALCRKLKKNPETLKVPFMMLADEQGESHAAECIRAGADEFVGRPFDLELLFFKVERLMAATVGEDAREGVKGSLDDMSFTDMIQIVCAGSKSMQVTLICSAGEGKVFINAGQIVHAQVGELAGDAAFYELMKWKGGEFLMVQCSEFPESTIQSSAMSLLMEGARLVDEG